MKFLVFTLTLVGVVVARPDVSHLPTGSYLPTGGYDLSGSNLGIGGISGLTGIGGFGQEQRHIFFFGAHDDEGPSRLRVHIAPTSSSHSKVIFVKAPSYGPVIPEVIAPPSQAEDKTRVYVLVKRPQHHRGVTIPASAVVKQAKPEVYFIKYRSQQDAAQQISGTLSGQNAGAHVPDLENQSNFVNTLTSGFGFGGAHGGAHGGDFGGGIVGGLDSINSGVHIGSSGTSSFGTIGSGTGLIASGERYGPPGVSGPYKR